MRAAAAAAQRSEDPSPGRPVGEQVEDGHVVRTVAGTASARPYRCPGCDQELTAASPHLVVWPDGRPDDRRHWHPACWSARGRRGVKVHRSKNAPRYG